MEYAVSQIGLNHHLSVADALRQQTRALYEGVLGASVMSPRPDTEIFKFANGSVLGVSYIDPSQALTPEQHLKAIGWNLRSKTKRRRCQARSTRNPAVRIF